MNIMSINMCLDSKYKKQNIPSDFKTIICTTMEGFTFRTKRTGGKHIVFNNYIVYRVSVLF